MYDLAGILFIGLIGLAIVLIVLGLIGYALMFLPSIVGIWLAFKLDAGWGSLAVAGLGILCNVLLFGKFSDLVGDRGYDDDDDCGVDSQQDDDWLDVLFFINWIDKHEDDE